MITFQQLIYRLAQFWEKKGCIIHQGHDLEVGAGTFNPATFLRSLGPEPYATAYVEPSRRPSDGRFGKNPNRVQLFHQFQVVIKPSPADIQATYLKSLETIGFDLKEHDIRFVHDDWESPTLGAWGLGWEVWCDGMEVSQFTYFQGIASLPLKPVCAEITYGLERLCMFVQNVDNIFDIQWNDHLTLGDISKQSEVEWSSYNFSEASTEMWLRHFDDFEKEAQKMIALHLPIPAYDFVIKASHAFNILDARGVISTTERTGYIARIRDLARLIGIEYIASREKLGFPLLSKETLKKPPKIKKPSAKFDPEKRRDFLLEIGSEQLPATFVPIGLRNLEKALGSLLDTHGLKYDKVDAYGTPRRLALRFFNLAEGVPAKTFQKRGPSASAPAAAREGFLKSVGLSEKEVTIQDGYLYATVQEKGKGTAQILAEALPKLIADLDFPKKMRWGDGEVSYARPIHWIVALFGEEIIPFAFGDTVAGRFTWGHAQLSPKKISLASPDHYLAALKEHFVLADIEERKHAIASHLPPGTTQQARVLPQVVFLTEWPQVMVADFDPAFLKAPPELLISEMVEHQKYFPLAQKNQFVITADNQPSDLIRKGNEKVLSARLSDGLFLYEHDLKIPLESLNQNLRQVTFQKDLGSLFDKVVRLVSHVQILNTHLEIADSSKLGRAALLSKADLASLCVKEFPELQGTMGKHLALHQKEPRDVALALEEQWLPKSEGGPLPTTPIGALLSLADKIDNLLGYYAVNLKPTSSSDPYALRRQAIGILRILIEGKHAADLSQLLQKCSAAFSRPCPIEEILRFITARAKGVFEDYGFKKDEIEASLHMLCTHPYDQFRKVEALHAFRSTKAFASLFEVYKRAKGQLVPTQTPFNPALLSAPAEQALNHTLDSIHSRWRSAISDQAYAEAYTLIAELQPPLAHLFETVKILADDPKIRENRLALLQKIFTLFHELVDFSQLQDT
jgi:glycyl-tRNA synthetase